MYNHAGLAGFDKIALLPKVSNCDKPGLGKTTFLTELLSDCV